MFFITNSSHWYQPPFLNTKATQKQLLVLQFIAVALTIIIHLFHKIKLIRFNITIILSRYFT